MIKVDNLGFYYKANNWLFKNISLDIKKGEVITILGPNGRGKLLFKMFSRYK
ncbi:hypothetical protein MASR2M54_05010 [Aliarcobacter cryaerophilus]